MNLIAWIVFAAAALIEVGGDAVIRLGLHSHKLLLVIAGFLALGSYGLLVNQIKWEFSRMLGVYVGFFALVSVLFGRVVFQEPVSSSTWIGLGLIVSGCLVIQFAKP
jgi:drug/metabolite transporter superfamily protein YnfA